MSAVIFIVEDERIVAEDIRATLEAAGYRVAGIASSRDQAIEAIRRTAPDLVLMDIALKGLGDGMEAGRMVRELFDLPVVYLTAHADQATLHRAKLTEPFGYILKPFEERELYSAIEMALYRHRAERRLEEKERWLATILGSITDGVIAADAMGTIRLVNTAAERIGGWSQSELVGRDLAEVYCVREQPGGAAVELPSLRALMEEPCQCGIRQVRLLTRQDGGMTVVEQRISPISDGSKAVSGSVVVFRELAGSIPGQDSGGSLDDLN